MGSKPDDRAQPQRGEGSGEVLSKAEICHYFLKFSLKFVDDLKGFRTLSPPLTIVWIFWQVLYFAKFLMYEFALVTEKASVVKEDGIKVFRFYFNWSIL